MNNFEERLQERLKELKFGYTSVSNEELIGFEAGARWAACFNDVEFIDRLFAEYKKSHEETKPGQVFPRWLDNEQLKWVLTVARDAFNNKEGNKKDGQ